MQHHLSKFSNLIIPFCAKIYSPFFVFPNFIIFFRKRKKQVSMQIAPSPACII